MAATDELRARLAKRMVRPSVNQYDAAPAAPAAPPATVTGLATNVQPAGLAQAPEAAPGLAASPAPQTPAASIAQQAPAAPAAVTPTVPSITTQRGSSWQGTGPDPRDATYYAYLAKLNSDANIAEANLELGTSQHQIGHDQSAAALLQGENVNLRSQRQANARGGIGYSTQGGNAIGDVEYQFATQNAANDQELANWLSSAELSKKAIEQGFTVDEAAALAEAAWRKAQTDAALPKPPAGAPGTQPGGIPGNPNSHSGPPGPNYVWDASRNQWTNAGPPPGPGYQFDPTARRWVHTGSPPGAGYHWDFARNRWTK